MPSLLKHSRRSDVVFNRNGKIYLSSSVVRTLGISPGDTISIAYYNGEYFLCSQPRSAVAGKFVARCYPANPGRSGHFRANSVRLCNTILEASGQAEKASLPVGDAIITTDGYKMLPIIVRLNLNI